MLSGMKIWGRLCMMLMQLMKTPGFMEEGEGGGIRNGFQVGGGPATNKCHHRG